MKIHYKIGDLIEAEEQIICHGCNAQGVMGSGVALAIKYHFPEAFKKYREEYETNGLKVGDVIFEHTKEKIIANCITQEFYGRVDKRYVSYDGMRSCFQKVNKLSKERNLKVALPLIGANLGGGDWSVIYKIVEEEFDKRPSVYVLNLDQYDEIVKVVLKKEFNWEDNE